VPVINGDEIDFTAQTQGNVNLGANTYVTTGGVSLIFTGQNTGAGATNFDITAAGLRCVLNAVNTMWDPSAPATTGPAIWIPLSSLYTAYAAQGLDASCDLYLRMYCSTITWVNNTTAPAGLHLAIWGVAGTPSNSVNRYAATIRFRQGGVECMSSRINATGGSNYTTAPANTSNVFGLNMTGGNAQILGGVWGGAWSSSQMVVEANTRDATATTNSSFRDQNNRAVISFSTGNVANNGSTLVVERMRFDWSRKSLAA
jgi:hypothetical protein